MRELEAEVRQPSHNPVSSSMHVRITDTVQDLPQNLYQQLSGQPLRLPLEICLQTHGNVFVDKRPVPVQTCRPVNFEDVGVNHCGLIFDYLVE